ncbi:hypothetical protein [Kitasatospora sp. NPDC047058]|uniref:hypothetical protein n=1 Tax=Kitasatospora sp. NPDC047058 TaxID=3155620 RepID=UPI0033EF8FF3
MTGTNPLPASQISGDPYAPIPLGDTPEAGQAVEWDFTRDPHFLVASLAGRAATGVTGLITTTLAARGLRVDVIDPRSQSLPTGLAAEFLHTDPEAIHAAIKDFAAEMQAAYEANSVYLTNRRFLVVENAHALAAEHRDTFRLLREISILGWATGHHLVLAYPARQIPGLHQGDLAVEEFARLALTGGLFDTRRPLAETAAAPGRALGWIEDTAGTRPLTLHLPTRG